MCIFVSRPMKIVTFLRKNDYPPKRVVDFPLERDTFRNKIMEIVEDFDKKLQQQRQTLEIVEDFASESNFFHFSFFFHHFSTFLSFFSFFQFFHFLQFFIFFN